MTRGQSVRFRGTGFVGAGIVLEEAALRFLRFVLFAALRVQTAHLGELLRSQAGQMPDEVHELPGHAVVCLRIRAPGRPAGESNTVLDDPEDLPVRKRLSRLLAHVRSLRIEISPNACLPRAIVGVARRAVVREVPAGAAHDLGARGDRIDGQSVLCRDSEEAHSLAYE